MRLLQRLPASVVRRVHRERHDTPYWITLVPEHQRLTDDDLQEFTRSLIGAALLSMFRYCKMPNREKSAMFGGCQPTKYVSTLTLPTSLHFSGSVDEKNGS